MTVSSSHVTTLTIEEEDVDASPIDSTISPKPTRAEVLDAIVAEAQCDRGEAGNALAWITDIVDRVRASDYTTYYPKNRQMRGRNYQVFDAIIQHGQASQPGSAHEMVERFVLDPTRDETALFHDNRDEEGSPNYCSVQVALGVIR